MWQYAKYIYKTVFVHVTVVDHAGIVHAIESNSFVTATPEILSIFHPFRRLFDVFTYRTININYGVKLSLLESCMLKHRASGLTLALIEQALQDISDSHKFLTPYERIDERMRQSDLADEVYGMNHDCKQLLEINKSLLIEFLTYLQAYYLLMNP